MNRPDIEGIKKRHENTDRISLDPKGIWRDAGDLLAYIAALEARSLRDVIREALGKREWVFWEGRGENYELSVGSRAVVVFEYRSDELGHHFRWIVGDREGTAATADAAKSAALDALADIIAKELTGACTCFMCGGETVRETFTEDIDVRGKTYRATGEHERCSQCREEWWQCGMKDILEDAYRQYREERGLPTREEQVAIADGMGVDAFCKAIGVTPNHLCHIGALVPKESEEKLKQLAKEVTGA